jgi:DnaJ-class molecular chaperone
VSLSALGQGERAGEAVPEREEGAEVAVVVASGASVVDLVLGRADQPALERSTVGEIHVRMSQVGAGFGDIFDAFFGGAPPGRRARAAAGADLRYDLRISFEESIRGAEKDVEFAALTRCETCSGTGAAEGTDAQTCEHCGGRGEVRSVRRTMLGQMVNVTTCPVCQ